MQVYPSSQIPEQHPYRVVTSLMHTLNQIPNASQSCLLSLQATDRRHV